MPRALLTQAMVLTSKALQFLPLSACWPVNALAGIIPLGLLHPSGNRLGGRLELARQLFGRASRSHQIDHLSPGLRRISGSVAGYQTPQKPTSRVSTQPGQLQYAADIWWRHTCRWAHHIWGLSGTKRDKPCRVRSAVACTIVFSLTFIDKCNSTSWSPVIILRSRCWIRFITSLCSGSFNINVALVMTQNHLPVVEMCQIVIVSRDWHI